MSILSQPSTKFQITWGFVFASTIAIDLNMGYLSIPFTKKTQKLLAIVTPFGFFESCVLPMGIRPATDIFQSRMVGILQAIANNEKENKTWIHHGYKVGDLVLTVEKSYEHAKKPKLSSSTHGS